MAQLENSAGILMFAQLLLYLEIPHMCIFDELPHNKSSRIRRHVDCRASPQRNVHTFSGHHCCKFLDRRIVSQQRQWQRCNSRGMHTNRLPNSITELLNMLRIIPVTSTSRLSIPNIHNCDDLNISNLLFLGFCELYLLPPLREGGRFL